LLVSAAVVVFAALAIPALSAGSASAKAEVCPTLTVSGAKYSWETVGTGYTCGSAKPWVVKLVKESVDTSAGKATLTNGPKGLHCFATDDEKGHASAGTCYKGTLAFPKSGFAWFKS
jgi:hypothetical protein